jgi:transcriptional regulator with XRE-family HTH domain
MDEKKICERLREFRKCKKITAAKMAEALGKTPSGYGLCELGKRNLPLSEISIIFHMGCNLNWLIAGEGTMEWDEKITPPSESAVVNSLTKSLEAATDTAKTAARTAEKLADIITIISAK